ncbi:MAG TPA: TraU family protein [Planctomycetota bacterium]|nr:TraU family protein [Planctomycetota bacterium]
MTRLAAALLAGLLFPQDIPEPAATIAARADLGAIFRSWRIKGVLGCPHKGRTRHCLWVENAFPCGLIEVVRRPGASLVAEAQAAARGLRTTGGHTEGGLQFADARVHTLVPFPPDLFGIPIAKPWPQGFRVNYLSELDPIGWRIDWWDRILRPWRIALGCETQPAQPGCAGTWGAYYPRTGFVLQPSQPKAAFLQAVRAGRVASDPAGRVVLSPYAFEPRTGHYLQMIRPVWRPAIPIGSPGDIDAGAGSMTGSYLFLHFGIFEECHRCLPPRLVGPR